MKVMLNNNIVILATICLFITSCATSIYKPSGVPLNEMAHIKEMEVEKTFINITHIDGLRVESLFDSLGGNPLKKEAWVRTLDNYDIKPGKLEIDISLQIGLEITHGRVAFIAESGKTYRVMANIEEKEGGFWTDGPNIHFFIEDDLTGENVSDELLEQTESLSGGLQSNNPPLNLIPMYGYPKIEKSEKLKKADEKFINTIPSELGSRENASKSVAMEAWIYFKNGDNENAMRRFNQSWLLNPNNYDPYWGFGALLLAQHNGAEAVTYFEKSIQLLDDNSKKPGLLSNTARAYSSQAIMEPDKLKRAMFFEKANAIFSEATTLNPKYANAYRAWALSLYLEGNYKLAWEMVNKHRSLVGDSLSSDFIDNLSKEMPEPN